MKKVSDCRHSCAAIGKLTMLQMVLGHETQTAGAPDLSDRAEQSRPGKSWKQHRNGKLKGTI